MATDPQYLRALNYSLDFIFPQVSRQSQKSEAVSHVEYRHSAYGRTHIRQKKATTINQQSVAFEFPRYNWTRNLRSRL